jgi:hypothetical protein
VLRKDQPERWMAIFKTAIHAPGRTTVNQNGRAQSETGPSNH